MAILGVKGLLALCGLGGAVVAIHLGTTNTRTFHIHSYDQKELNKYADGREVKVASDYRSVTYTVDPQGASMDEDDDVLFVDLRK